MRNRNWYIGLALFAIVLAYITFIMDIILNELVRNYILTQGTNLSTEKIYKEIQLFQQIQLNSTDSFTPAPISKKEQFIHNLCDCVYYNMSWWTLFDQTPWEACKFFWYIFQITICYIIISIKIPLQMLLDYSVNIIIYQELIEHNHPTLPLFNMWVQVMLLAVLTIWARSVGPRFRPDQLSQVTWKDILLLLGGLLVLAIVLITLL